MNLLGELQGLAQTAADDRQGILRGQAAPNGVQPRTALPVDAFAVESFRAALAAADDAVGYYRIRDVDAMALTARELALADELFPSPDCVVLLISRSKDSPEATFFFRENGAIFNFALLTFPLDSAILERRTADQMISDRRPAAPVETGVVVPAVSEQPRVARSRLRRAGIVVAWTVLALAAGVSATLLYFRSAFHSADAPVRPAHVEARPLRLPLRAERQGKDLRILWDANDAALASAASGTLDIEDGGVRRIIPLDGRQVRLGTVLYTPISGQVSLHLTVVNADGSSAEAVVLVIVASDGGGSVQNLSASAQFKAPRRPAREFVPPSGDGGSPPVLTSGDPEELPAAKLDPSKPELSLGAPAPPPPQNASGSTPAGSSDAAFEAAVLIYSVGVRTPPELRGFQLAQPASVKVRALVDESGRVIEAAALPQNGVHAAYLNAATDAAKRCRFRAARRGATPVRSEVTLTFRFGPNGAGG